jgi:hypothetical protein
MHRVVVTAASVIVLQAVEVSRGVENNGETYSETNV